jgi:hypothetical protein
LSWWAALKKKSAVFERWYLLVVGALAINDQSDEDKRMIIQITRVKHHAVVSCINALRVDETFNASGFRTRAIEGP